MKKQEIEQFLNVALGQKEAGLIIVDNRKKLADFLNELESLGLKESKNVFDLFKNPKTYLVIEGEMNKDIYDFIVQYPTGQVEIFNLNNGAWESLSPDYEKRVVVFLVIRNDLKKIKKSGFDFLPAIGPAYQE